MLEILGNISLSEVILIFLLIFLFPVMGLLIQRLRRYEAEFGDLPASKKKWGKKKDKGEDRGREPEAVTEKTGLVSPPVLNDLDEDLGSDVYPYRQKAFLTGGDKACLAAMREVYGPDVEIFPKVALWETVEPTVGGVAHSRRLFDKDFDFLICDARTMKPLTAVLYNPKKGPAAGRVDEIRRICQAAATNVVFIDTNEKYDAKQLRRALGVPEF